MQEEKRDCSWSRLHDVAGLRLKRKRTCTQLGNWCLAINSLGQNDCAITHNAPCLIPLDWERLGLMRQEKNPLTGNRLLFQCHSNRLDICQIGPFLCDTSCDGGKLKSHDDQGLSSFFFPFLSYLICNTEMDQFDSWWLWTCDIDTSISSMSGMFLFWLKYKRMVTDVLDVHYWSLIAFYILTIWIVIFFLSSVYIQEDKWLNCCLHKIALKKIECCLLNRDLPVWKGLYSTDDLINSKKCLQKDNCHTAVCCNVVNPLNPVGPHADQNKGVSEETRLVRMRTTTCSVKKSDSTRLVSVHTIVKHVLLTSGSPLLTSPSIVFFFCTKMVAPNQPESSRKMA